MIITDFLDNHPDAIQRLAEIWHTVLGQIWLPDISLGQIEQRFENHCNSDELPMAFVALDERKPVGMCSLRKEDGVRPDLMPWLGSLVVDPAYQKQGIGKLLMEVTQEQARNMGFKKLYLSAFDPTIPDYYARFGWKKIGMDRYHGHPMTIMEINL